MRALTHMSIYVYMCICIHTLLHPSLLATSFLAAFHSPAKGVVPKGGRQKADVVSTLHKLSIECCRNDKQMITI